MLLESLWSLSQLVNILIFFSWIKELTSMNFTLQVEHTNFDIKNDQEHPLFCLTGYFYNCFTLG